MSTHSITSDASLTASTADRGWFGQPAGLSTLFFTEMWERLSYYGMRALLVLYMVAPLDNGGMGLSTAAAATIYGWYTALVYAVSLPGGFIADRWLGQYKAVFIGGCIIVLGHLSLALPTKAMFFPGLALIILGTGLLKPNISSLVGALYDQQDQRRDGGFSIFYMGVNVGAMLAPLVCGTLGQKVGWHWGFGAAGVGMILGVVQYWFGRHRLEPALKRLKAEHATHEAGNKSSWDLSAAEWKRLGVIGVLFVFAALFWAAFEQAGSSLNLFADKYTRLTFFGKEFPSTWFQSLNPVYIIIFAPLFTWMWAALGRWQPSSPAKFTLGLLLEGLGFLLLVPAATYALQQGPASPLWLCGVYLLNTWGELCLSPVALSLVTKLSPPRLLGTLVGFWYLSNAAGNKLGGWIASYFDVLPLPRLFGYTAGMCLTAGILLVFLIRPLKRMMGGVR